MNPIDIKNAIEQILGVTKGNAGAVTSYGLMGKYVRKGGIETTAFAIGEPPQNIDRVEGLEIILTYPDATLTGQVGRDIYSDKVYRLSVIARGKITDGHNAVMLLEKSGAFMDFKYQYVPSNSEINSYPQWNCKFKQCEFREKLT